MVMTWLLLHMGAVSSSWFSSSVVGEVVDWLLVATSVFGLVMVVDVVLKDFHFFFNTCFMNVLENKEDVHALVLLLLLLLLWLFVV